MKILLIDPPWYRLHGCSSYGFIPLGLCYLAAVLRENGHRVSVYNAELSKKMKPSLEASTLISSYGSYRQVLGDFSHPVWREVKAKIRGFSPDLVGVRVMTPTYASALNVAKLAKESDPEIPIVFGGPHPTVRPEETVREKVVDVVVRGEGEHTLLDLVNQMGQGSGFTEVEGITYQKGDKVIHNLERPLIKNLNELPFPARDLLSDMEIIPTDSLGTLIGSRGCPYQCIYCFSIWGRRVRFRSAQNIVEEVKQVYDDFGTRSFGYQDDTFTINEKLVREFCELVLDEEIDITWGCNARADRVKDDLLSLMKKAGCESIYLGVESGDEETLRRAKRGMTTTQIRCAARLIKKNEINLAAYWMIGFPWESRDSVNKTLRFMREIDADWNVLSVVTAYPGTELFEMAVEEGLIHKNPDWASFSRENPEMMLTKGLTVEESHKLVSEVQRACDELNREGLKRNARKHLRPDYILRKLIEEGYYKKPQLAIHGLWETLKRAL